MKVIVYLLHNVTHEFSVPTIEKGREYAHRIITEGLWVIVDPGVWEEYWPVHQIVKVVIREAE